MFIKMWLNLRDIDEVRLYINILEFFFLNFLNMFILCKVLYIGLLRNEYEIFNNLVCIKYCKNMRKYILVLRCDNL